MIEAPFRPRRLAGHDGLPSALVVSIVLVIGLACTACASPQFSDGREPVRSGSADAAALAPSVALGGSDAAGLSSGDSGGPLTPGAAGGSGIAGGPAGAAGRSDNVDAGTAPAGAAPADVADAGAAATPVVPATPPVVGPPASAECPAKAVFSLQFAITLKWQGRSIAGVVPLVRGGMGTATVWARWEFDEIAGRSQSVITSCGMTLPDMAAGGAFDAEQYGFHYADSIWDRPSMPRWTLDWKRKCKLPGCALESELAIWTVGASVAAGTSSGLGPLDRIQSADHDGDGYEGLSLTVRSPSEQTATGGHYSYVPFSVTGGGPRAETLFTAMQIVGRFYGNLEGCDAMAGLVQGVSLEMRPIGCLARASASASQTAVCSIEQSSSIDQNMPVFEAVTEARFEGRRVADTADCAAVRQVWK